MKKSNTLYILLLAVMLLASCAATHKDAIQVDYLPIMSPQYDDVTIPVNIAPLNFLIRDKHAIGIETTLTILDHGTANDSYEDNTLTVAANGTTVQFDVDEWKDFLQKAVGKKIKVQIYSHSDNDTWTQYKPFTWEVVGDSIDPYLTYQLIEPDYKVWNGIQIKQRCIENFREKILADHHIQGNKCMNCHIVGNQDPNLSMIYLNGDGKEAILNRNGKLRKLDIENAKMATPSVYYGFSPSGKYITFSTNKYTPAFHADPNRRIEVYDNQSEVYVANLDDNTIISSPLTSDENSLETFPSFSPDGKYIYYCVASKKGLESNNLRGLKYALVRIPFDEASGKFGDKVDTLYTAQSTSHPRVSPDGRYCLFTVSDFGTCPAWHPESDLRMIDLSTGEVDSLSIANSVKSDTYHSWSHNSRWFVFASKRGDGLYSKPYFCYIDRQGKAHKPFLLPQKEPSFYDDCLKSFNIPELSQGMIPFDALDLENAQKQSAEKFK